MESDVNTLEYSQAEVPVGRQLVVGQFVSVQSEDFDPGVGHRSHFSAEARHVDLCDKQTTNRSTLHNS